MSAELPNEEQGFKDKQHEGGFILAARPRVVSIAAAALTLLLAASGNAQAVHPRFNWPVGSSATVNALYNRLNTENGRQTSTVVAEARYELSVREHPEGRLIRFGPPAVEGKGTVGRDLMDVYEQLFMPTFVVSSKGDLLRLEDTDELRRKIAASGLEAADTVEALRSRLTDERLRGTAHGFWWPAVEAWKDVDLELGKFYETRARGLVPAIPGETIDVVSTWGAAKRVPCTDDEPGEPRCVLFQMRQVPEAGQLREILRRTQSSGLVSLNYERSIELVTEPDGLIPHRLEVGLKAEVVTQQPDGASRASTSINATRWVFTWR